ncbi:MAG: hypothetical protein RLZZ398_1381 [Verrucomicrobiota bacterium]
MVTATRPIIRGRVFLGLSGSSRRIDSASTIIDSNSNRSSKPPKPSLSNVLATGMILPCLMASSIARSLASSRVFIDFLPPIPACGITGPGSSGMCAFGTSIMIGLGWVEYFLRAADGLVEPAAMASGRSGATGFPTTPPKFHGPVGRNYGEIQKSRKFPKIVLPTGCSTNKPPPHPKGALAQLVEHLHGMQGVSGSNPLRSTIPFGLADLNILRLRRNSALPICPLNCPPPF